MEKRKELYTLEPETQYLMTESRNNVRGADGGLMGSMSLSQLGHAQSPGNLMNPESAKTSSYYLQKGKQTIEAVASKYQSLMANDLSTKASKVVGIDLYDKPLTKTSSHQSFATLSANVLANASYVQHQNNLKKLRVAGSTSKKQSGVSRIPSSQMAPDHQMKVEQVLKSIESKVQQQRHSVYMQQSLQKQESAKIL